MANVELYDRTTEVFHLSKFGAVSDGVTDDTNAISAAHDACAATGGGTIIVPEGETLFDAGAIEKNFTGEPISIVLQGSGSNSRLKIRGEDSNKLKISNALSYTIKDLLILGADFDDVPYHFNNKLFHFFNVNSVALDNVIFAGVRMNDSATGASGAVFAEGSRLLLHRVKVGGCAATLQGFFTVKDWHGLTARHCQFIDYIEIDGEQINGFVPTGAWIKTFDPAPQGDRAISGIVMDDVIIDEGASYGVFITGNGDTLRTASVDLNRIQSNVFGAGSAVYLNDVDNAKVRNSWFGFTETELNDVAGIEAINAKRLELDNLRQSNDVNHIWLKGTAGEVIVHPNCNLNPGATYPTGFRNEAASRIVGSLVQYMHLAVTDETTVITTGTAKLSFRMPHAFNVTKVKASLATASSSGVVTVDINDGGTTILSTKLSIDASEKTSLTAATPAVISDPLLANDAEITVDIDAAGTDAAGLKIILEGYIPSA